ncbi:MAG: hypothetical protein SF123_00085 [Chloroflexota bacterium]|nr:hypothetical protein [Chloroflexota bacterium]
MQRLPARPLCFLLAAIAAIQPLASGVVVGDGQRLATHQTPI